MQHKYQEVLFNLSENTFEVLWTNTFIVLTL